MVLGFLKKNGGDSLPSRQNPNNDSFNEETTQKVIHRPALEPLERDYFKCPNCQTFSPLNSLEPLTMFKCSQCASIFFTPMKIKDFWLYVPLGGGGMGSVYRAFHAKNPDVEAAVKILPRSHKNDASLVNSLLKEAAITKSFGKHPHLASIYEYGCSNGEYFAAYEYIDGIRLDQVIDAPARRADKEVLLWSLQILSAEQHIFDKGYLYRDLKPQNVIINCEGNVKLIDFGLVTKIAEAHLDDSNTITGSPHYMPPERITGEQEGQFSEIYSLGMLLYHMMSKQTFFKAENNVGNIVQKHVNAQQIINIRGKLPPSTNPELIAILEKMIDKNPMNRFQSYKAAGSELFKLFKTCA